MAQRTEQLLKKTAEAPAEFLQHTADAVKRIEDEIVPVSARDTLTKAANAPNEALQKALGAVSVASQDLPGAAALAEGRSYWRKLGPGLITGASGDDPSGIATYSQTGSQYGNQFLLLAPLTFPLMALLQEMCGRIGLVTGRGLAGNMRLRFRKPVLLGVTFLLFIANAINIGANLGAMASAVDLIVPSIPFTASLVGFTLLCILLQVFMPYMKYARYLKWLALVLLAYVVSAFLASPDWGAVAQAMVMPQISFGGEELILICAILGTTITPYMYFWQTSQEVEEQILQGKTNLPLRRGSNRQEVKAMRIDVWSGAFLSNLVMFFIILSCAAVLYTNGITTIETAAHAAEALRPFAGQLAFTLFAVGIIGTGLLAIPIQAGSSSYAIAESLKWRSGLYRSLKQAYAFYGLIIISMLVGFTINFLGINPIRALIYTAVLNGLIAPIVIACIVKVSSDRKVMGEWVNPWWKTVLGWGLTTVMGLAGIAAIVSMVK